jgi:nicotinate-nucleotide--dimethylbenzimidazole phosphoribosyltransferase
MLDQLRLAPALDLEMRLGEGTGACILMGLMEAAVKIMRDMATFESAGVEGKVS